MTINTWWLIKKRRALQMSDTLQLALTTAAITSAAKQVETQRAAMIRPDGELKYGPKEADEYVAKILEPLRAVVSEAGTVAEAAEVEAQKLELMQHSDPVAMLAPSARTEAESLRPFVADYCAAETLAELVNRLAYVSAHGSAAEKALYVTYGRRRYAETYETVKRDPNITADTKNLSRIGRALDDLRVAITPAAVVDAMAKAVILREGASRLRGFAKETLATADGSAAAFAAKVSKSYRENF